MADILQTIFSLILGVLAFLGLGFGYLQNRKYKHERESKVNTLMEGAHELAKSETESKSIDQLMSDRHKRFSGSSGSKPEEG